MADGISRRGFIGASSAAAALLPALAKADGSGKRSGELGPGAVALTFSLNGKETRTLVEPRETLAEVLLHRLDLTGTKIACDRGACGACTVHIEGRPHSSCMTLALDVEGKRVTTIEGISERGQHPVQVALHAADGLQCGYCIPGFVMSACALFDRNKTPSSGEINDALAGNLCRCGSQPHITQALQGLSKSGGKR